MIALIAVTTMMVVVISGSVIAEIVRCDACLGGW